MMTFLVIVAFVVLGSFALHWREKLNVANWIAHEQTLAWWRKAVAKQLLAEGELTVARWDKLVEAHGFSEAERILAEIRRISPEHR
jgi:H+/Cl- antiporter ClcA